MDVWLKLCLPLMTYLSLFLKMLGEKGGRKAIIDFMGLASLFSSLFPLCPTLQRRSQETEKAAVTYLNTSASWKIPEVQKEANKKDSGSVVEPMPHIYEVLGLIPSIQPKRVGGQE